MKSLLTLPLVMVLLTACGSAATRSDPDAVESTETVESSLCNATCPHVSFYYCAPDDGYRCGPCEAHNAIACYPIPASGTYSVCGGGCPEGGFVTQYYERTNCDLAGTPKLSVNCAKPYPDQTTFTACGLQCPSGYTLGASWFERQCDAVCAVSSSPTCTNTADNAMRCDKIP
ncbi:hypothetical protein [Archangium primigenium]|uniref:hypothetical protein n=1 Tax=[Archangium] primigenium TaxID=2792470 RepID=UPI00195CBB31|nr:hypothetical protein [Archangium primigenium]MBM7116021.1 hypothetical protein [Archangium primigenium]